MSVEEHQNKAIADINQSTNTRIVDHQVIVLALPFLQPPF